jgi:hypothetical protein
MKKNIFFIIFLNIFFSQSISDYPYVSAKPTGMVGAVVSEKGDSWSIFHNPAAIVEINDFNFSIGNSTIFGVKGLTHQQINGYLKIPILGRIGLGLNQLKTEHEGIILSEENTLSIAQGITLQRDKNSQLAIGYTMNLIQWDLGKSAGSNGDGTNGIEIGSLNSMSLDIGLLASLRSKFRFGIFMKNFSSNSIGTGSTKQDLTQRINLGITYMPLPELSTSLVSEKLIGNEELQIKGSISYNLSHFIEIYSGIQANPNRLGAGMTITILDHEISYGIITHPVLPLTQQFNLILFP